MNASKRLMKDHLILLSILTFQIMVQASNNQQLYISRTQCTLRYSRNYDSINFTQCINTQFTSSDWKSCFVSCCNSNIPSQYDNPSVQALEACKTENFPSSGLSTQQMAIIVTCTVIMGLLCICFFCKLCLKMRKKKVEAQKEVAISVQWSNEDRICSKIGNIVWSERATIKHPLRETNQPCTICLEQNTTALLICKHQFHPKCIGSWLKKSDCCPFCRQEDIQGIKVYCQTCRWRYMVCTIKLLVKSSDELPKECEICLLQNREVVDSLVEIMPQGSNEIIDATRNIQESVE